MPFSSQRDDVEEQDRLRQNAIWSRHESVDCDFSQDSVVHRRRIGTFALDRLFEDPGDIDISVRH